MDTILYVGDSYDIKQVLTDSDKKIDAVQNGMIALNALSDSANKYGAVSYTHLTLPTILLV